jgi:formylglycine-generating enzyme required for sulfatase activity
LVVLLQSYGDAFQSLEALVSLLMVLVSALVGLVWRRKTYKPDPARSPSSGTTIQGNVTTHGDFTGRDKLTSVRNGVAIGGEVKDSTIIRADNVVLAMAGVDALRPTVAPKPDLQAAANRYLSFLLDRHQFLNFKGLGVSDRVPLRLPLLDLYVPLQARLELPPGETWDRRLQLAGRPLAEEEQQALAGRLGEPQAVLELLQHHDGLVILGDPGAGKTTFLKFLTLQLAGGQGAELGLGERLPILLPLSGYANALEGDDIRLDDFIAEHFRDSVADLPLKELLTSALHSGRALVLLDGLDEVKASDLRHTVIERVIDFYTFHRRTGNKFVLTSRIIGYKECRPTAPGLAECTLIDFEDGEIQDFITRWTVALERQAQGDTALARADAARERQELLDAVERNAGVRRLAANPLLLTILAVMKRQGVTLPERRVELYDQYVKTLLSSWNRVRGLGRSPRHDLDPVQTIKILAPLALWMHSVNPGVGLVKREELRRKLGALYRDHGETDPARCARHFLEDVREYAGLLLERGPGEYGFIHLTFEEYLAAVAIALDHQGDAPAIAEALGQWINDPAWHEIILLTVGYIGLIQQMDRIAGKVVERLIETQPGEPGAAVVLAGEAVADAGPAGIPLTNREQVITALIGTMQAATVANPLRRRAGLALGRLGWLPPDLDTFVEVPAGRFLYGDGKHEREIPYRYWIGQYPVTNVQYVRFIQDNGYQQQEFWSEAGWCWRQEKQREQPDFWQNAKWNNPIFPVVGVSHYEAVAYCHWLASRLSQAGFSTPVGPVALPAGYTARLPTEEEWERAARGLDGREYPWDGEFRAANANIAKDWGEGVGTTAVCTYPQGRSPVGAWDMSGNVWEWTSPRRSADEGMPVVRGGSWAHALGYARAASRNRNPTDYWYSYSGFRVVLSLANSGF